ncbi:hypothetical protein JRO89_XS10G0216900 [Xanthoceras sorbifolium]|uniref:non-specific serine/threonine protein kinase n=1 Tax=Xanthoceras sorbifolium TaxID=99658 RepID=A0ABQ8HJW6_9ROSI|nr:hypothetical protein JRO89_XS10G0216900 [Xanthoceras sorbifolium]
MFVQFYCSILAWGIHLIICSFWCAFEDEFKACRIFVEEGPIYKSSMSQPKIKRRVGKYEVGRTIGEGTFAKVKFARNSETGEPVALKILDKEKVLKHKMAEQVMILHENILHSKYHITLEYSSLYSIPGIKREIATMKLIKHPNVVRLYEVSLSLYSPLCLLCKIQVMGSKTKIFIVLEFVTGGELFDKIVNHGRMREDEARRYFQQLINVVDYCHSRGVYHRDLKPENLLLDAYGNLKVSDFGLSALSQQVRDDGLLHTTCGTPNYVAPEVLNDRGYDGATADLWSCGVILFVLLAGYLPFDDSNLMNLYKKISAAEFTCPPWISFAAMKLITRILDPNPMTVSNKHLQPTQNASLLSGNHTLTKIDLSHLIDLVCIFDLFLSQRITIPEILEDEWFKKDYKTPVFEEKGDTNLDDVEAVFKDSEEHHVTEKKEEQPVAMNAFELISLSKGLNLGNCLMESRFECQSNPLSEKHSTPLNDDSPFLSFFLVNLFLFFMQSEASLVILAVKHGSKKYDICLWIQGFKRETRFTSKCPANEIVNKIEEAAKPLGFDVQKKNYKMRLENVKAGRKGNLNVATEIFQVAPSLHMVEVRKAKGDTLEFHKFYKNLSTCLEDVVWKTEEDMQQNK